MSGKTIVLVGFEDQPNLGVGYLTAVLMQEGFDVEVLDFRLGSEAILERIKAVDPLIVGLSIIFQYYTPDFAELVAYLRDHGVTCPICAGGHYPSLRPDELLAAIPGLDCVVRFEGEYTLLEMARRLAEGRAWQDVESIVYRADGQDVATPLRPLIADLDSLPFPYRRSFSYSCLGIPASSILASRGCPRHCSFCSIRRFYSIPPGSARRTRSADNVVQEMSALYNDHGVRVFLFQDDDFSLISKRDREWAYQFVDSLQRSGLYGSVIWKINCRADEVEEQIVRDLQAAGLFMVYLGLESGNETGLRTLNKRLTVQENKQAVEIVKRLDLRYDFGFMLFDPSSTVDLVLENERFLRDICGDGSATASFGKMLPYAGTDVEEELRGEGRLFGDLYHPDYAFLDRETNAWFEYLAGVFYPWVYGQQSLQSQLRWAQFELDVLEHFHPAVEGIADHKARVTFLISWYNEIFCRIIEDSAGLFRSSFAPDADALRGIKAAAEQQRQWLEDQLARQRMEFFTASGLPLQLVVGEIEQAAGG